MMARLAASNYFMSLILAVGDAGLADGQLPGRATFTLSRASFDGRELTALAVICAETDGLFFDEKLASTFEVRDVVDCKTNSHVNYTVADVLGKPAQLRELKAGLCVGRNVTLRVHRLPTPARSGCVDISVGALARTRTGDFADFLLTVVRVQP